VSKVINFPTPPPHAERDQLLSAFMSTLTRLLDRVGTEDEDAKDTERVVLISQALCGVWVISKPVKPKSERG
jgi:hypothetical protein